MSPGALLSYSRRAALTAAAGVALVLPSWAASAPAAEPASPAEPPAARAGGVRPAATSRAGASIAETARAEASAALPPDVELVPRRWFRTASGLTVVEHALRSDGIEVLHGRVKVAFDGAGRAVAVSGGTAPSRRAGRQTIDAHRAARIAASSLGPGAPAVGPPASQPAGRERRREFPRGAYFRAPTARLVYVAADAELRLAWLVTLPLSIASWHEVAVDAESGAVLQSVNLALSEGPEGMRFDDDPDDGPPQAVPLAGSLPAPHDAWAPGEETLGNNVIAGSDRAGEGEPLPAAAADGNFVFDFSDAYELSGGADAGTDLQAAISHVFYWNNALHDRFYALGFTEAAGNFQQDNFGLGGAGEDPVKALVQFGADSCSTFLRCTNNAYFLTHDDGAESWMAMLLMEPPLRYVDGAFASDVIVHEYAHGVTSRLIGAGSLGFVQGGALGEGWSDWWAASVTGDPVFGEYWNANAATGARTHSMANSDLTYGDLCTVIVEGCNMHADGEIWAATLWDLRRAIVARYGEADGGRRAEQLVFDGIALTPPLPTFLDARDALLQADHASSGTHACTIWRTFAGRGMGLSAATAGNTALVQPAGDIPQRCSGDTTSSDPDGMPDAYEQAHACLSALIDDAASDADGDRLTNLREWEAGTAPCAPDSDGDGCGDGAELGADPEGGGRRDPLYGFDFFDTTGDAYIDLVDALDVLAFFGADGRGASQLRDRRIVDKTQPWRTADSDDGVDLIDAMAVLKSYGHNCA